jgi:hypothetical protein
MQRVANPLGAQAEGLCSYRFHPERIRQSGSDRDISDLLPKKND